MSTVDPKHTQEAAAPRRHAAFIRAELQSKPPHLTAFLLLRHSRAIPDDLVADLQEIGFAQEQSGVPRTVGQPAETYFRKPGSGLFGDWTERERHSNLVRLRAVLRRHDLHPGTLR